VAFVIIVVLMFRAQQSAWKQEENETLSGVVTSAMPTSHTPTPLFLSHANGEQENPDEDTIATVLSQLQSHTDDTVTLDDPDLSGSYLQTYMEGENAFCVEYYEGATYRHYRAEPNPDLKTTQSLFFLFNRRDWDTLKQTVNWRDVTKS
jgi:hypothetical protein